MPDQDAVIALLSSPATHGGSPVERIETHASVVFLAGDRAWKLKRAVKYDYLDFSTADRRREMCEAELRLNRRAAPELYHRVVAITRRPDGTLELGGTGEPVDWVLEMRRFDQEALFDRLAARGALDLAWMRPLAAAIARFHRDAEVRRDHGGRAGMAWVIDGNARDLEAAGSEAVDQDLCASVTRESRAALERGAALLEARREAGLVRHCHGDLHLRNIVLFEGRPTLFDAVEFNDEIACVDVLYDLAFLLMDLWRRDLPPHANAVWNAYLLESDTLDGLPLLPLFLSCRAAVRAKTSLAAAALQRDPARVSELRQTARAYLAMAQALLRPAPPALVAIGGLSGSGKSSLAYAIAPAVGPVPGAVVLRSDQVRKQLFGVPEDQRLGPEGYTAAASARVYDALAQRAAAVVRGGHCAIVDAVFAREPDRARIESVARDAAVPFAGLWLDVPEPVLIDRVTRRRGDASDADAAVVRLQLEEGIGTIGWTRIDAAGGLDRVRERALQALGAMLTRGEITALRAGSSGSRG